MAAAPAGIRAVVLVGLRAAGKTTVGRLLAARLGWPFADSDAALATAVGQPAGAWLAAVGEAAFRAREAEVVAALLAAPGPFVLATGGGAVTIPAVRAALQAADLFVAWLDADPAVLLQRAVADGAPRPPLTGLPPAAELAALRAARQPFYAALARCRIDTGALDPAAAAAALAGALPAAR